MTGGAGHRRTLRNAGWIFLHRSVSGCAVLVAHALFARMLLPAEVGLYHLAVFVGVVAGTLACGGLSSAATRFIALEVGRGCGTGAAIARRVLLAAAIGVALVAAVGVATASLCPASWRPASLGAMVGFLAAHSVRLVAAGLAGGFAEFGAQARASLAASLVMPAGAVWLWFHGGDVSSALWVTAAHAAATAGIVLLQLRGRLRAGEALQPVVARRIWRYCGGVTTILLLDVVVWQQSEAVFLRLLSAPTQLGLYAVAFSLATQAMQLVPGSLGAAMLSALAYQVGKGDERDLKASVSRSTRLLAVGALPIAAFGALFADEVMVVLYGAEFGEGASALRILWSGTAAGTVAMAAAAVLYASGRERVLVAIGLPVAALNIALDVALIAPLGAIGAAFANSMTQIVGGAVAVCAADRILGGSTVPWRSLIRIAAATAAAAIAASWARAGSVGVECLLRGAASFGAVLLVGLFALREVSMGEVKDLLRGKGLAGGGSRTVR